MFHNSAINEMTSKHIMADRLREAREYRLLKQAEAARRQARRKRTVLGVIRETLARRAVVRPTTVAG